jgi:hypothetical protein
MDLARHQGPLLVPDDQEAPGVVAMAVGQAAAAQQHGRHHRRQEDPEGEDDNKEECPELVSRT